MQRCVLAIDSGGTKCEALLARDDGTVLGYGRSDFHDLDAGRSPWGSGRAYNTIHHALQLALGEVVCDEVHIGGFTRFISLDILSDRNPQCRYVPYRLLECPPMLTLIDAPAGLVVLAGTGAMVYGQAPDGRTLQLDGLGPMLADLGGGYSIGAQAARAAARAQWHPRHATSLAKRVFSTLTPEANVMTRPPEQRLIQLMHTPGQDRALIASLAQIVNEEAERGDAIAQQIIDDAAAAIADTLFDVVDRLGMADGDYPLIAMGGVAMHSSRYWQHVVTCARQFAPRLRPVQPTLPPVVAMALSVLQTMGSDDPPLARETLLTTARETLATAHRPAATELIA